METWPLERAASIRYGTYDLPYTAIANIDVKSSAMQIPMAVPYFIMAFGCAGISFESVVNMILYHKGIKKKSRGVEEENPLS